MKNNKYILYAMSFLQGLVFYGAFSVIFRESRGLDLSNIFLLESIFVILMLVFEIPWGIIADKIGYKNTLVISSGLFLLSKIVFCYSYSFLGFLLEVIIVAMAISGISGCDSALLYSSIEKEESDKVFGIYGAMGTAGFLIASLISGILVKYSIGLLAFATIIPYSVAFLLSFALQDVKKDKEVELEESKESILQILKLVISNKRIIVFVVAVAILGETTHSICVFFNQPLYIKNGIDLKWFGVLSALMQVATFIGIKAYRIKRKLGEKKLLNGAVIMVIVCNFFLIRNSIAFFTIALIFIIEGAFALTGPITETIKNESITSKNRATILSVYAMISNIIAAVMNMIISVVSRISLEKALLYCLFLNIIAMIFMASYLKEKIKK